MRSTRSKFMAPYEAFCWRRGGFRAATPSPGSADRRASIPSLFASITTHEQKRYQQQYASHPGADGAGGGGLAIFRGPPRNEDRAGASGGARSSGEDAAAIGRARR